MTPEGKATKLVRASASALGMRLFRNNRGGFYDERGRFVNFGLGNESTKNKAANLVFGDVVGITPITITPEMVGKTIGVFTNIEIKPDGDLEKTIRKAQSNPKSREGLQFKAINFTRDHGGISWFATNGNDVDSIFKEFIASLTDGK